MRDIKKQILEIKNKVSERVVQMSIHQYKDNINKHRNWNHLKLKQDRWWGKANVGCKKTLGWPVEMQLEFLDLECLKKNDRIILTFSKFHENPRIHNGRNPYDP